MHYTVRLPFALNSAAVAGEMIGESMLVDTMHHRKTLMNEKSDALIALPGGFGTMEELVRWLFYRLIILRWKQSRGRSCAFIASPLAC